jgi:hypothetical protein
MYMLILICASHIPVDQCTMETARAYQAFIAPPGIIICGVFATTKVTGDATGPDESEYMKTRCQMR